jgi:hypothetical protein
MMTMTNNIDPKNLMMLAALGIGAYFLMTRKAHASQVGAIAKRPPTTYPSSPTTAITGGTNSATIAQGLNMIDNLFRRVSSTPIYNSPSPNADMSVADQYATYSFGRNPTNAAATPSGNMTLSEQYAAYGAGQMGYVAAETADNPTTLITSDPQLYASTGGFLDSQ